MARTKNQATAAMTDSARRPDAVNGGGSSRVDNATVNLDQGEEVNIAVGSGRAQRAARRDTSRQGSDEVGGEVGEMSAPVEGEGEAVGDSRAMPTEGVVSENYFSVLAREFIGEVAWEAEEVGTNDS
jgi:hypothetical protein